jgi:hypothetical protein
VKTLLTESKGDGYHRDTAPIAILAPSKENMDPSRRRFNRMLTSIGLAPAFAALTAEGAITGSSGGARDPQTLRLSRNGWMPNNELNR